MKYPKINSNLCTGCRACIDVCPMNTIIIENGKARIIEDKCQGCLVCQGVCPRDAIEY